MVIKGGSATTAKRKKTDDMPDSPPKRVTRARAKITDDVETKSKPDKAAKVLSKAAADKKKAPAPTKAPKRKTRADEDEAPKQEVVAEPEVVDEPKAPAKSRGRQNQTMKDEAEVKNVGPPKTKGRQPRGIAQEKSVEDAPKTRGRPKKTTDETSAVVMKALEPDEPLEPTRKTTRGRLAAKTSKPPATNTTSKATTTKKKVKFQEEPDKENIPMESEGPKKSAMKATGLKAKPVRKPATAGTTSRGRMATRHTSQTQESLPLSPKKVNQVTNTGSTSSEDELSGEKTPIRALSRSPSKPQGSPVRNFGSVSKLNLTQPGAPTSPSKAMTSAILASPARRPPASPFKDALKSSPKKFNIGDSIGQPVLLSTQTSIPVKASLLQESPRKGKIGDLKANPILPPSQTPLKASLLQSPARRPMVSPFKGPSMKSPGKASTARDVGQSWPLAAPTLSPPQAASSPFRAARSPEPPLRVHKITDEERKAEELTLGRSAHQIETFSVPVDGAEGPESSETPFANAGSTLQSSNFVAPAFSTHSAAWRRISIESGSEDELASPEKIYAPTPLKRYEMFGNNFETPAIVGGGEVKHNANEAVPMTPLAEQMSSWLASTPGQQNARNGGRQARGVFSLGGAASLATPEQDSLNYVEETHAKSSFFEDEMAVFDGQEDNSIVDVEAERAQDVIAIQTSQDSQASEEYGDENAAPFDAEMLMEEQNSHDHTLTCTPAKVFTPAKQALQQPREIYTVSKVPLRPSAEYSPPKVQRQRSRSFGDLLSSMHEAQEPRASNVDENETDVPSQPSTPLLTATLVPQTPSSGMRLDAETPGRTVRKGVIPDVLKGAVVYVDVHTTEGADASGIFVDLLTQMGARCVKQWSWNPRASLGHSYDSNDATNSDSPACSPSASKVGISHVVYKDGGKRTLEKVRSSNGAVLCVGVGWVLE